MNEAVWSVTEEALLRLCYDHYARTRRIVTTLAVPPGTIEQLKHDLADDQRYPGNTTVVLYIPGGVVTLEELAGATAPSVLSDEEPRR